MTMAATRRKMVKLEVVLVTKLIVEANFQQVLKLLRICFDKKSIISAPLTIYALWLSKFYIISSCTCKLQIKKILSTQPFVCFAALVRSKLRLVDKLRRPGTKNHQVPLHKKRLQYLAL